MKGKVADAKTNVGILIAQLGATFDEQVTGALHRLGVPTRNEISHAHQAGRGPDQEHREDEAKGGPGRKAKKPAAKATAGGVEVGPLRSQTLP